MDNTLAETYLRNYLADSTPILNNFFENKLNEAALVESTLLKEYLNKLFKLTSRGKKIRGALVLLGYEAASGKRSKEILKTSLFIEIFQSALLIHDDIMDKDEFRRGLKTIHKQYEDFAVKEKILGVAAHYGESMAMTIGDIAIFLSYELLLSSNFPSPLLIKAAKLFSYYAVRVGYGQALDITVSTEKSKKYLDIKTVMQLKTADYSTTMPFLVGATLAGCTDREKIAAMKKYAESFGWAYQLSDDLLGMFGNPDITGKPIGTDLREGKQTLIINHLREYGNRRQITIMNGLIGKQNLSLEEIKLMQKVLKEAGSYQYTKDLGLSYVKAAKKEINKISDNQSTKEVLESLLDYIILRNK